MKKLIAVLVRSKNVKQFPSSKCFIKCLFCLTETGFCRGHKVHYEEELSQIAKLAEQRNQDSSSKYFFYSTCIYAKYTRVIIMISFYWQLLRSGLDLCVILVLYLVTCIHWHLVIETTISRYVLRS